MLYLSRELHHVVTELGHHPLKFEGADPVLTCDDSTECNCKVHYVSECFFRPFRSHLVVAVEDDQWMKVAVTRMSDGRDCRLVVVGDARDPVHQFCDT